MNVLTTLKGYPMTNIKRAFSLLLLAGALVGCGVTGPGPCLYDHEMQNKAAAERGECVYRPPR